jgi:cytochrome b561
MSTPAEERGPTALSAPAESYDRILKALHWSTVSLITAIYIAIWVSHDAATKEQQAILMQLHRSLGITVFALTLFRLGWRWHARIPNLPVDLPAFQKFAARAVEYLLYALLLLLPLFGILGVNARGRRVDFFFLGELGELPAIIGPDKALARQAITAHQFVAYLLLGVIALHAAAALLHHFVRRDDVLNRMLFGQRAERRRLSHRKRTAAWRGGMQSREASTSTSLFP